MPACNALFMTGLYLHIEGKRKGGEDNYYLTENPYLKYTNNIPDLHCTSFINMKKLLPVYLTI